ncbi:hypothetical protein H5410_018520 [Solanum commersonii]|uniref:Uncharacterized protein n=1 Tax=Solanum commersonii TaxID=4109 RepID=A0A9J6A2N7_SOLCO|nr:hypothetical protein H5410_018520 [Solanum commersonii]
MRIDGLFKSVKHLMKNSVKSQCAFLTSLMVSDLDSYIPQEALQRELRNNFKTSNFSILLNS